MLSKRIGLTARITPRAVRELVRQMHQSCRVMVDSVAGHMVHCRSCDLECGPARQPDFLPLRGGPPLCSLLETRMLSKTNIHLHAVSLSKMEVHFSIFFHYSK